MQDYLGVVESLVKIHIHWKVKFRGRGIRYLKTWRTDDVD
jgi:hypothetical protein